MRFRSDMKARPILFSADMIRALLDSRKSQTRRIVKPQPQLSPNHEPVRAESRGDRRWVFMTHTDRPEYSWATGDVRCPYGIPGDLLWVRETWAHYQTVNHIRRTHGGAFDEVSDGLAAYRADGFESIEDLRSHIRMMNGCDLQAIEIRDNAWKPSIHMPRWASRLTLRITNIRVERLQDISEADARAEGVSFGNFTDPATGEIDRDAVEAYEQLWESINGAQSWAANPWVWAISFDVIQANVDDVLKREAA